MLQLFDPGSTCYGKNNSQLAAAATFAAAG